MSSSVTYFKCQMVTYWALSSLAYTLVHKRHQLVLSVDYSVATISAEMLDDATHYWVQLVCYFANTVLLNCSFPVILFRDVKSKFGTIHWILILKTNKCSKSTIKTQKQGPWIKPLLISNRYFH